MIESKDRPIAPAVQKILRYKKSGSVLDLGSGAGRHAIFLAKKGFRVTAVDKAREKLAELRRNALRAGVTVCTKQADIARFVPRGKYDVIVATMSFHFLKSRQVRRAIVMVQAHTKSRGINVVSGYTDVHPKGTRPYLFKKNELRKFYAGWNIVHYEERLSRPFVGKEGITRQHRAVLIARKPP